MNRLKGIRENTIAEIRNILAVFGITEIKAVEIDEDSSPVIIEDAIDGDFSYTLDAVRVTENGLEFDTSNNWERTTYTERNIPTDALLDVEEWLLDNCQTLKKIAKERRSELSAAGEEIPVTIIVTCKRESAAVALLGILRDETLRKGGSLPESLETPDGKAVVYR